MNIEIMPAKKSCQQGCATCPLSSRNTQNLIKPTKIDENVQETFSLVESIFAKFKYNYRLQYVSDFNLMPEFKNPSLVSYVRFETRPDIKLENNSEKFAIDLQKALHFHKLNSSILGFSLVPDFPLVNPADMEVAWDIFSQIKSWHFKNRNKHIELTLRSNMIKEKTFNSISDKVFANDKEVILQFLKKYGTVLKPKSEICDIKAFDLVTAKMFFSKNVAVKNKNKLIVTNRIIAPLEGSDSPELLYKRAGVASSLPLSDMGLMITPQGVMFCHSSIEINNPLLWVSHEDFRKSLRSFFKEKFTKNMFDVYIKNTVKQNCLLYSIAHEHKSKFGLSNLNIKNMLPIYEGQRAFAVNEISKYVAET